MGMSGALGDVRCEAVRIALYGRCPKQRAQHVSCQSDPGLFLAHNRTAEVVANPVAGTPAAGNAERLTAWFQPTGDLERVVELSRLASLVAVVGEAGVGKSAIAAALIRPEVAPGIVPPRAPGTPAHWRPIPAPGKHGNHVSRRLLSPGGPVTGVLAGPISQ
jgi:hypothetical protein